MKTAPVILILMLIPIAALAQTAPEFDPEKYVAPYKLAEPEGWDVERFPPMKKIATEPGDVQTFSGTVSMMDYMSQNPVTLNCLVHVRSCPGTNNTVVFHQLSPQPTGDAVWAGLRKLWSGFECIKGK